MGERMSTNRGVLFLCSRLLIILGDLHAGAKMAPSGGEGHGIFVKLEVPWTTLNSGEQIQYQFILRNASGSALPIAVPDDGSKEDAHFGWPAGGQPFLEPKYSTAMPLDDLTPLDHALVVGNAQWPPKDGFGEEMRAWLELPAGRQIIWNQNRLPGSYFSLLSDSSLVRLQAHWLVGPGRWVSSDSVPIKVVSVPMSQWTKVFEAQWSSYGFEKNQCNGIAYTIPIEGRLFLFWENWRVTEVSPEDRFEHEIDKEGTNLEITITGAKGVRKAYVHLRHAITRDTPWPIGPVSLFYPKPEPIPPAELAALRKTAYPGGFSETGNSRPERRPGVRSSGEASPSEKFSNGGFLTWMLAVVSAFLIGVVTLVIRKKGGNPRTPVPN